jgi:hypothetical protein
MVAKSRTCNFPGPFGKSWPTRRIRTLATVGRCLRTRWPTWRLPWLTSPVPAGAGGEHAFVLALGSRNQLPSLYLLAAARARKVPLATSMPIGRLEYAPIGPGKHSPSTKTVLCWQLISPSVQTR